MESPDDTPRLLFKPSPAEGTSKNNCNDVPLWAPFLVKPLFQSLILKAKAVAEVPIKK